MVAPFELVMEDSALQENWFRRIIAFVIDGIILAVIYGALAAISLAGFFLTRSYNPLGFASVFGVGAFLFWIIGILYFAATESTWGASIGKRLLALKVVDQKGNKPLIKDAFIRNVSRIHFLLFLLDVLGGLVLEGDPRQRFTDRMSNTVVYHKESTKGGPYVQPDIIPEEEVKATSKTQPTEPAEQVGEEDTKEQPTQGRAFCRHCGAPVEPHSKFCPKCGKEL